MLATGFCLLRDGGSGGSDIGGAFGGTWSEDIGLATGAGGIGEGVVGGASLLTGLPRIMVLSFFQRVIRFDRIGSKCSASLGFRLRMAV